MATITWLNASTIMRNIEKMRSTYLRRVGSNKFWEIIKYYNTITSPTKYLVWVGLIPYRVTSIFFASDYLPFASIPCRNHLLFP